MTEEKTFTESEVKELLTGLLKEIEAKTRLRHIGRGGQSSMSAERLIHLSDIRTLFNKLLQ